VTFGPQLLLIAGVAAVGVLHTIVPDHWVPIALMGRQRGWSRAETARAALQAGTGHALSTLFIALVIWLAGVAFAERFGRVIDTVSSLALIAFGGWIAVAALRDTQRQGRHDHAHHEHGHGRDHGHRHDPAVAPEDDPLYVPLRGENAVLTRHVHVHRHGRGFPHAHWHDHTAGSSHSITAEIATSAPAHDHLHKTTGRMALLLILGSSPMVEGIPAFFAAAKYGVGLIAVMAVVFAASTISTYVLLCVYSTAGLQRMRLGAFERYGEVMSGAFIALVGVAFWIWSDL
jgi:ABC-type nickel/cobalt efflux system permease component RcnA